MKGKGCEEAGEEKFKTSRGWFMRFMEKRTYKCIMECQILMYDTAKIIHEGGCTK